MAGGFPISGVESSLFNLHPPPALTPSLAFLGSMPGLLFWQAEPKEMICKQRLQVTLSLLGLAHCRVSGRPPRSSVVQHAGLPSSLHPEALTELAHPEALTELAPLAGVLSPPQPRSRLGSSSPPPPALTLRPQVMEEPEQMTTHNSVRGVTE